MNTSVDTIHFTDFKATFQTGYDPPPYSYFYELSVSTKSNTYWVDFQLKYLDRDELTEEEILDEGFTLNDDFSWAGEIPEPWYQELVRNIEKTHWRKEATDHIDAGNHLLIKLSDEKGNSKEAIPSNLESWEYLLQEVIQAIFELSGKEKSLQIQFKSIEKPDVIHYTLEGFFSDRKAMLMKETSSKSKVKKDLTWKNLKNILKGIYAIDFENLKSYESEPVSQGVFISPGDDYWYKLPTGKEGRNSTIEILESFLKD